MGLAGGTGSIPVRAINFFIISCIADKCFFISFDDVSLEKNVSILKNGDRVVTSPAFAVTSKRKLSYSIN